MLGRIALMGMMLLGLREQSFLWRDGEPYSGQPDGFDVLAVLVLRTVGAAVTGPQRGLITRLPPRP